jgi:hypothetical protein
LHRGGPPRADYEPSTTKIAANGAPKAGELLDVGSERGDEAEFARDPAPFPHGKRATRSAAPARSAPEFTIAR